MKKLLFGILMCVIVFWGCRIYRINQIEDKVSYYTIGSSIEFAELSIVPMESHLYTPKEYEEAFHSKAEGVDESSLIVCIYMNVTNLSDKDMSWDDLMDQVSNGFETTTWASATDPFLCEKINVFRSKKFKKGSSQKIWFATNIVSSCFKKKNWENIKSYDFYYVLSLDPLKIKIKLDSEEPVL